MNERKVKLLFAEKYIDNLIPLFKVPMLRLYALEFSIKTEDGEKFADMVLECSDHVLPSDNQLFVLEWKKGLIDLGAVEQVLRYSYFIQKQLYRKQPSTPCIVGEEFSAWEIKMAKDNHVLCIQYDLSGHVRLL